MVCYSSEQFYKDWRYSVEKDFASPSDEPVKYAQDGFRTWGGELSRISFPKSPIGASVNCDGSLIAIAAGDNIYIYNTVDYAQVLVCKGHVSNVDALSFQPGNPKVLVSSAQDMFGCLPPAEPKIILWDLDRQQAHPMMEASVILTIASRAAETVVTNLLQAQPRLELSATEEKSLISAIEPALTRIIKNRDVANQRTLDGRLEKSFQSEIFSPSGDHLIYLPGRSPRANGNDIWDVKIYSMSTHKDLFTLTGHTDALMWTGYSPDESVIGTVAWDESIRIWDAANGHQKYKFNTSGQNWTGGFSPDSQRFAGTCGDGSFYIYSMSDGATLVHHKLNTGHGWMRALSWSADSKTLAVGGDQGVGVGSFFLYDVARKEITQQRILSTEACPVSPEYRKIMGSFMECCAVRFVDGGRKVVVLTSGDGGIETYDLETWEKWRFARPGIDPITEEESMGDKEKEEDIGEGQQNKSEQDMLVHGGYHMTVWEDQKRGKIFYASMDGDAVRIWDVPMSKAE